MKNMLAAGGLVVVMAAALYWLTPATKWPLAETHRGYLDMHVHVGCMAFSDNDCFLSPSIQNSYKFPFYLKAFGATREELEESGDEIIVKKLSDNIERSEWVDQAVVLALDGAIDGRGQVNRGRTQVYIPNDYVVNAIAPYDNLLYGASINPHRTDALERLERAKEHGAILVKWIPCIMDIDPAEEVLIPFYEKLVELNLPLLSHAGQERSFADSHDELCDPVRLSLPLELGVTVIAAHIATTGENEGVANFERIMPLFEKYPNLYTDISSLTQLNKLGFLNRALERDLLESRMIYGSDWPLQMFPLVSPWYHTSSVTFKEAKGVSTFTNQWDRDVLLKKAMGVPESVFERSRALFQAQP